jgi:pimeloyl-ACP methyl ester carboxylesterase
VIAALPLATKTRWRVLAPDYRGHGGSGRAGRYVLADFLSDVLAWIEHLAGRPLVIVGGSIGGALGMMAAAEGARVDGLVLLDVPTVPIVARAEGELAKVDAALRRGAVSDAMLDPAFVRGGFLQDVIREADRWRRAAIGVSVPTLLVAATRGVVGPTELAQYRAHIPHGEVGHVDAGHTIAREAPSSVARLVAAFVERYG